MPHRKQIAILGQSGDQQSRIKAISEDQSKRINNFLLSIPPQVPHGGLQWISLPLTIGGNATKLARPKVDCAMQVDF
jgi:hypothetical protein